MSAEFGRWTACSDELPPWNERVLCRSTEGDVDVLYRCDWVKFWYWENGEGPGRDPDEVKDWMPLPK